MKSADIKKLVAKGENAAVEFKRAKGVTAAQAGLAIRASQAEAKARPSVPADFWPSYSAFANTDGGTIILGIREKDGKREIEGLSDAENCIFSLVRIGERSGMGLSSLYGVWEKEKFAEPSIIESYEPDRTEVVVEFEADESELGVKKQEVREKTREVGVENAEVGVKTQEVVVEASELGVNPDFDVLMGAYRNDFRANARKVLSALAEHPEMDFVRLSQVLNLSQNSVWRAVRALREVGLLVREGADKGGKWIVKK
jgi:predicted HTH transcriptional regulator